MTRQAYIKEITREYEVLEVNECRYQEQIMNIEEDPRTYFDSLFIAWVKALEKTTEISGSVFTTLVDWFGFFVSMAYQPL